MRDILRSPQQKQLRKLLREMRLRHGLTQEEVAERLGNHQSFVSKYEGGERRLSVIEFVHVARALDAEPVAVLRQVIAIVDSNES
jgi:transcriptional regulator with XRE-family HTH domain